MNRKRRYAEENSEENMSAKVAKILDDALKLAEADRADLAACLFASLDEKTIDKLAPGWDAKIERRLHAIDNGKAKLIPWEKARKRIFGDAHDSRP